MRDKTLKKPTTPSSPNLKPQQCHDIYHLHQRGYRTTRDYLSVCGQNNSGRNRIWRQTHLCNEITRKGTNGFELHFQEMLKMNRFWWCSRCWRDFKLRSSKYQNQPKILHNFVLLLPIVLDYNKWGNELLGRRLSSSRALLRLIYCKL